MSLDKALKNLKYDVRMVEFNLNHGQATKEEIQAHLKTLPDLSDNATKIDLEEGDQSDEQQH